MFTQGNESAQKSWHSSRKHDEGKNIRKQDKKQDNDAIN